MLKKIMKNYRKRYRWLEKVIKQIFLVKEAGSLYFQNRLCEPDDKELKKKLLCEAHNMVYTMHLGDNKMY